MFISRSLLSLSLLMSFSASAEQLDYFALSIEELLELEVKSASGLSEQLKETPTPVSVITEQMIRQSGVNTLRDLLTLYIPSFVQVQDQNEYNAAFRGVYTSAQQKFLILLNGHRLNSRAYSMASPDLSIALEKIKHIEVLRGPGSSVHGNAALTSVINIVSKSGGDLSGPKIAVEVGNHGYREVFAEAGNHIDDMQWYAWFKYAESNGEPWIIQPEQDHSAHPVTEPVTSYLDGFFNEPSYDYGLTINTEDEWQFLVNYRQSHYVEPLTTGGNSGAAFDINDIPLIDNIGPGAQSEWLHSYVSKSWQLNDNNSVKFKFYYDTNKTTGVISNKRQTLTFSTIAWQDKDLGFSSQWQHQFEQSTLLFGVDYDYMKVTNSNAYFGSNGKVNGELSFNGQRLLPVGSESIWSGYAQVKTQLSDHWLINGGLRFDYKNRHIGSSVKEVSPRLALIRESEDKTLKLSYAKSFVDPAYWNRYSNLTTFQGSEDLKPEMLESIQVTPEFYYLDKSLQLKLNLYYNEYKDVVYRKISPADGQAMFTNAGQLNTLGFEQEISYHLDNKVVRFIGSQTKVVKSENHPAKNNEIYNIPQYQFNLIFDHELNSNLDYQISLKYLGKRRSPISAVGSSPLALHNELGASVLFNANVNWQLDNLPVTISFNVQNATDKQWYQGGSVALPYRQTGRWYKLGFEYKFSE